MRKSLFLTLVLALVLVAAGAVSAQSFSAFGNVGYGKLSLPDEDKSSFDEIKGGVAFQAGAVYNWMDNFGVGVMYDRMTSSGEMKGQKVSFDFALSGFSVLAVYGLDGMDLPVDVDLVAGLGSYTFSWKEDDKEAVESDPTFGYLVGAKAKYDFGSDLTFTGNVAYRSAKFEEFDDENGTVSGWTFGAGVVFEF